MRYSIIVPIYNGAGSLRCCVESVRKQSLDDWQLILVDDGSLDDSCHIMEELANVERRILCIHQENSGPFMARKTGIDHAQGDYLLFLDCDDIWEEDCLTQLDAVIAEHHPDMICYTAHSEKECIGWMGETEGWLDKNIFCRQLMESHCFNAIWCKAFRKELFANDDNDYEAFRGICWGEDKAMLLHPVHQAEQIYYLPKALYRYHRNPNGLSKMASSRHIDVMLSEALFELLEKYRLLWNVEEEGLKAYQLKNLLNVYWRCARFCKTKEERKLFTDYPWYDSNKELRAYTKLLKGKEKLKYLLAWRLHWRGLR